MKEMIPLSVGAAASGLLYREHSMRTKAERLSAATLEALLNTIDANDETTGSHVRRVAAYAPRPRAMTSAHSGASSA